MAISIIGTCDSLVHGTAVLKDLKNRHAAKNVNLLYKGKKDGFNQHGFYEGYDDTAWDGAVTGASLASLPGLALGAGVIGAPFLGAAAFGALPGLITGTVGGGIIGALIDMGIEPGHQDIISHWIERGLYVLVASEVEEKEVEFLLEHLKNVQGVDNIIKIG